MDFCKGNVGGMFWSTRKCVKKMRLQLFQVYTTDIAELLNHLQKKRPLEHCKMALPEFKIIETETEKEKVII